MEKQTTNMSTAKDQIKMLNKELKRIAKNVTATDRKECVTKLKISKGTISTYLRGNAKDIDKASKLLVFFTKRIENRKILKTA